MRRPTPCASVVHGFAASEATGTAGFCHSLVTGAGARACNALIAHAQSSEERPESTEKAAGGQLPALTSWQPYVPISWASGRFAHYILGASGAERHRGVRGLGCG